MQSLIEIYLQATELKGGSENNLCLSDDLETRVMTLGQGHGLQIKGITLGQGHDRPLGYKEHFCTINRSLSTGSWITKQKGK